VVSVLFVLRASVALSPGRGLPFPVVRPDPTLVEAPNTEQQTPPPAPPHSISEPSLLSQPTPLQVSSLNTNSNTTVTPPTPTQPTHIDTHSPTNLVESLSQELSCTTSTQSAPSCNSCWLWCVRVERVVWVAIHKHNQCAHHITNIILPYLRRRLTGQLSPTTSCTCSCMIIEYI